MSAIIVTHSRPDLAAACASSVACQIGRENVVIVVNCASSVAQLENLQYRLIVNEMPLGYGENLNKGALEFGSDSDFLVLLNDDTVVQSDAMEKLAAALKGELSAGIAGPRIVDEAGVVSPSCFQFPSVRSTILAALILPAFVSDSLWARWSSSDDRFPDWILGAALMVRTPVFRDLGGFDTGYFLNFEEIDFARRLRNYGLGVVAVPDAVVRHLGHASIGAAELAHTYSESYGRYIAVHWNLGQLMALTILLPICSLWNLVYLALRTVVRPNSFQDGSTHDQAKRANLPRILPIWLQRTQVLSQGSKPRRLGPTPVQHTRSLTRRWRSS